MSKEELLEKIRQYTEEIEKGNGTEGVYFNRGNAYYLIGKKEKAIEDYTKALEINPEKEEAYYNRGNAYAEMGKKENAIEDYTKALEINPEKEKAYYNRGMVYDKQEEYNNAIQDFEKVIELKKYLKEAYSNLIEIYEKTGNMQLADIYKAKKIKEENKNYLEYMKSVISKEDCELALKELLIKTMLLKQECVYKKNAPVGHYTKINSIKYLVMKERELENKEDEKGTEKNKKARFRLNNATYMNDPTEGKVFLELLKGKESDSDVKKLISSFFEQQELIEGREELNQDYHTYLLSFSLAIDNLPMWIQYAEDGKGCCLILESSSFDYEEVNAFGGLIESEMDTSVGKMKEQKKEEKNGYCLYKVEYVKEGQDNIYKEYIEQIKQVLGKVYKLWKENVKERDKIKSIVVNILDQVRFLFKSSDYAHEKELRVIKLYAGEPKLKDADDLIVPKLYIDMELDLDYQEVILGPKVENPREIAAYLGYTKKVGKVSKSKIKYQ